MTNKNKKNTVSISFNVSPEVAKALDIMLWPTFDTRASYVRDLLVSDLEACEVLETGVPATAAQARARRNAVLRGAAA